MMDDQNRCEFEVDVVQVDQNGPSTGSWLCCLPCYWLKRNNSFHKASLTVATLLVTILLVASPVLFLISSLPGDRSKDCQYQFQAPCNASGCPRGRRRGVCEQDQCRIAAGRMRASMSWKTDPCQDFYKFACGSWAKNNDSGDSAESGHQGAPSVNFDTLQQNVDRTLQRLLAMSANSEPFQKLGLFYKSCLRAGDRRVSLTPMFSLLNDFGGYIAPSGEAPPDVTPLIVSLLRVNGAPMFDVYLDNDHHGHARLMPAVGLPLRFGFNTRFWQRFLNKDTLENFFEHSSSKVGNEYTHSGRRGRRKRDNKSFDGPPENKAYAYMKATIEEKRLLVMEKIMQEFMSENMSAEVKVKETHNTLLFVSMLTKLYPREKEIVSRSQLKQVYLETNVTDLQKRYPFVRWQYLLEQTLNTQLSANESILVLIPNYLDNLNKLISKFTNRIVHNGLLLVFATDTLYELLNTSSSADWPAFCARTTVNVFSKAVSALYVRQYRPEYIDQLRMRVTLMFENLKKTLEARMKGNTWLDEKGREAALRKLASLRGQFLTWPNFWNLTYVAALMDDIRVDPEYFFGNVIRRYQQLRTVPVDFRYYQMEDKKWAYPFVVNAFYVLTLNTIIIPLAVLTQPYFREDVPLYIPYSTMGLIFAHEILHGFDLKGIRYDSNGEMSELLNNLSQLELETRLNCIANQFSSAFWRKVNFLGKKVDVQFDWNVTRNENMADVSGLQLTYEAWKSVTGTDGEATLPGIRLSARQLFFLNAAQTYCSSLSSADYIFLVEVDFHTPHPERVNGIMMNSNGFADAYKCPVGSPMNPRKKCSVW